jgi:hypothetical protein
MVESIWNAPGCGMDASYADGVMKMAWTFGSIKGEGFFDRLSDHLFLEDSFAPRGQSVINWLVLSTYDT